MGHTFVRAQYIGWEWVVYALMEYKERNGILMSGREREREREREGNRKRENKLRFRLNWEASQEEHSIHILQ